MRKFWTIFTVLCLATIGLTALALTFIDEPVFAGVCGHHTWRDPATRPSIPGDASTCPTAPPVTVVLTPEPPAFIAPPTTTTTVPAAKPAPKAQIHTDPVLVADQLPPTE